jgi:hypothetical protein
LTAIKSMNAEHRSIARIFNAISTSNGNYTGLLKALL